MEMRYLNIIDCWHCPYCYVSDITKKRRCARESRNLNEDDNYYIPKWCTLPGKIE